MIAANAAFLNQIISKVEALQFNWRLGYANVRPPQIQIIFFYVLLYTNIRRAAHPLEDSLIDAVSLVYPL